MMACHWAPSEPQMVGPMPGVSEGPTTAAPSPSMNAVPRSSQSVKSESFSTPTTRTYSAEPPRIMSLASEMPWQYPAQAAEMSNAAQVTPRRFARIGAAAGVWYGWVTVEMTMAPSWEALIPAASSAWCAAASDMSTTVSSGAA